MRLIPGDPARVLAGTDADGPASRTSAQKYGLNDPIPVQYLRWIGLALRGDLGESIRTRESVARIVALKLPITLQLAAYALAIALLIAIPAGVYAAVRRNSVWDYLASGRLARRRLDPQLLARDHADPVLLGAPGLAAGVGYVSSPRTPGATSSG